MESEDAGVKLLVKVSDGEFLEVRARALYTSVEEAARIAGVAYERMSEWANSRTDPARIRYRTSRSEGRRSLYACPRYRDTR